MNTSQDNNNKKLAQKSLSLNETKLGSNDRREDGAHTMVEKRKSADETKHANGTGPSSTKQQFNIELVCNSFAECIQDKNMIDMILYLDAFSELNKFFNMFGTLFTFVTKDVQAKISILHSYVRDEEHAQHYRTIQSMIAYEKQANLLKDSKRASGSRTLLRLHRALEFISTFLHEVTKLQDEHTCSHAAKSAYNHTLARYHPWYIKQSVHLAMFALPYRRNLIERVYNGNLPDGGVDQINDKLSQMANVADQVFSATQKCYEEHDLLDLP